ncbi:HEPN domain-containing protein [Candidatus Peregrinibacteria bacterium]|nr:HEPN domain-containing protein [Candidatus Peregrinibacteria bacterium]
MSLSKKQSNQLIKYWLTSSDEKFKTMQSLYKTKRYADCLFFGHLTLEKILKALVVKETKNHAPYIHNLLKLAQIADTTLTDKNITLLAQVNEFNMQARYPDEKLEFYKICTKSYIDNYYKPIILLYKHLCRLLTQKK